MLSAVVAVCNATLALFLLSGVGYVVFVQGRSPWWFAAALVAYAVLHQYVTTREGAK